MTLTEFLNTLRILRSIDRGELGDAGLKLDEIDWREFRNDPYRWICLTSDEKAAALWSIVQSRQLKHKDPDHGKG